MNPATPSAKAKQLRLNIRLSPHESDKIYKLASNTTCRSVSDYARKVLAQQPVRVFYRNRSFDEFEERMIELMAQLERFGENFEQAVKKLPAQGSIPEIRTALSQLIAAQNSFTAIVAAIKEKIEKLADQCDQK
jgi:hypothetical protein